MRSVTDSLVRLATGQLTSAPAGGASGELRELGEALQELDPRSRRIVEARWLHDGEAATLHELAAEFDVSAERIRQIEVKALQKMRGVLAA